MKKSLIGLIVAAVMVAMSPVFAADYAYGFTATTAPAYTADAFLNDQDNPLPAAHVVGAKALTSVYRRYSVSYFAIGAGSAGATSIALTGEDDHYKSMVAEAPSKVPIMG